LKTLLKKGCSIGANTTIISGNIIGEYAFIGAGSVITKDIPPHTLWYGNPARQKGYITKSGIILDKNYSDKTGKKHNLEE
jgi:acetyltransferase-like isoleucine patch superfamily enzyme